MRIKVLWLFFCTTLPCQVFAGIDEDLNQFFNELGYTSNHSAGGSYKGQSAGLYTGGSLFARNTVRNTQLASVQLPSYRAGCGGIDIFTGGFSFINSDNLVQTMENIGNNAVSFSFLLALESMAPVVESTTVILNDWAQKINQANINSCESAASLVGGAWPKTDVAQQHVCEALGNSTGYFSDWAAARHGCGTGGKRHDLLKQGKNSVFSEFILQDTNIAWVALQKQPFLAQDRELAELFMSLSGTIIVTGGSDDGQPNYILGKPSMAANSTLIKALMHGGQTELYRCDTEKECLAPTPIKATISENAALGRKVRQLILGMMDKIKTDTPLTGEEIGFLESTRLPLYKMLTVDVAYSRGGSVLNIADYADVIAADIVFQYLTEALDAILAASAHLQFSKDLVQQFRDDVYFARTQLNETRQKTQSDIQIALDMVQKTQLLEQQLAGLLSSELASQIQWANGMK